jgi:hypothetical protein
MSNASTVPSFWSNACSNAYNRPQTSQFASFYAISGILVRKHCSAAPSTAAIAAFINVDLLFITSIVMHSGRHIFTIASQILCSCASAFASGLMLFRWRRLSGQAKEGLWGLYSFFTGFIFVSSCMSVATWSVYTVAYTQDISYFNNLDNALYNITVNGERNSITSNGADIVMGNMSISRTYWAAWQILRSIDFTVFCAANMMVLDRMRAFSFSQQKYVVSARLCAAGAIALCLVGFAGSALSAHFRTLVADSAAQTATAYTDWDNDNTSKKSRSNAQELFFDLYNATRASDSEAIKLDSIQDLCEMGILMVQVVLFLVMGVLCARRVSAYLRSPGTSRAAIHDSARRLHKQVVATAAVVFIAFLPRVTFATLKAVSNLLQDSDVGRCFPPCSEVVTTFSKRCTIPYNTYYHMALYLHYTPEFLLLAVLISSPLVQLVALWGMTSDRMLQAMASSQASTQDATRQLL